MAGASSRSPKRSQHRLRLEAPATTLISRTVLRVRRKALQTERAYVGWVQRYIRHCRSADLTPFGEPEIRAFLTDLAVENNVTSGTQNQAKCALFLFQVVMGQRRVRSGPASSTAPASGGDVPEWSGGVFVAGQPQAPRRQAAGMPRNGRRNSSTHDDLEIFATPGRSSR